MRVHARAGLPLGTVLLLLAVVAAPGHAQERIETTTVGGPGGGPFTFNCPPNSYLTGLRARSGAWIDAVSAECSSYDTSRQRLERRGTSRDFGGDGGGEGAMRCAGPRGVIVGIDAIQADNQHQSIGHLFVNCGDLFAPEKFANKAASSSPYLGQATSKRRLSVTCPVNHVAAGLRGRHGVYVDRIGLVCTKKPFTLGRPVPGD